MGRFDNIKTAIDTNINTNGNQAITGAVMNSVMKQTVDSVDTQLTELESATNKIFTGSNIVNIVYGIVDNKFVSHNGEIVASNSYQHTTPILIKKGQTISVQTAGYGFYALATCDSDGGNIKPLFYVTQQGDVDTLQYFHYTATEDVFVIACTRKTTKNAVSVIDLSGIVKVNTSEIDAKVLNLKGIGVNGNIASDWEVGEMMYNTNSKLVRKCTSQIGGVAQTFETVAIKNGALLSVGNMLYIYQNGDITIVNNAVASRKFRKIALDWGGITDSGAISDTRNDIFKIQRTAKYLDVSRCSEVEFFEEMQFNIGYIRITDTNGNMPSVGSVIKEEIYNDANWRWCKYPVRGGDKVILTSLSAGGRIPSICFTDTSNKVTYYNEGGYASPLVDFEIEAPSSGYLYINTMPVDTEGAVFNYRLAKTPYVHLTKYYYDENYQYQKDASSGNYLKLKFVSIDNSDYVGKLNIFVRYIGEFEEVFNVQAHNESYRYTFVVEPTHYGGAVNESALIDTKENQYSQLMLILPPNYLNKGEATRLVIYCQGSGGSRWDSTFEGASRTQYVVNEGYAVLWVSGLTNKDLEKYPELYDNLGTPLAMNCYQAAYNWVINNFNIKTDGVFVYGKSLGGCMVGNLLYNTTSMPIIACAGLAPTMDVVSEILRNRTSSYLKYYASQFNMVGEINFDTASANEKNQYFLNNANKVIGYNPLWNGTIGLDTDKLLSLSYTHPVVNTGVENKEEREAYESLPKMQTRPYKVWIARDDVNVDPRFCDYWQKMAQRAGSLYELRWMPENTGGHWAVDRGETINGVFQKPISAEVTPRYGNKTTIAVAYIEMIAWFRRFCIE